MEEREASRGSRRVLQGLLVGAAAAVLAAALWLPGALEIFEAKTWDLRARLMARPGKATSQVAMILLDQYSLDWARQQGVGWPWPRSLYGMIADFCRAGGAKALVVDVLYTEETNEDVSQDEELGRGFADNAKVVVAMNLARASGQGSSSAWLAGVPRPSVTAAAIDASARDALSFPYAQFPILAAARSARLVANTNLPADRSDGVYRREPLFALFDGSVVPSEALAAWTAAQAGPIEARLERGVFSARAGAAEVTAPVDAAGRTILRFRGPPSLTYTSYTAASVLNAAQKMLEGSKPDLDPGVLRDKYVFFGFTAPGLFDLKPTPMAGDFPGVEVNATMLDNLLSGDFMRTVPLVVSLVLLLVLCIGPAILVTRAPGAAQSIPAYAITLPIAPALSVAAYALGYWLPVVALELGALFSLVGSSLLSYATEGRQKRFIKGAFAQYLSPIVIEELIAHPERLTLGGEKRELTIFFSDIQGFTTISEALGPAVTGLLNEYLSAMADIIQEEGGTLDKFIGDAIVAFWNAPLPQEDHALRGTRAALRCQARLAEIRPGLRERYGPNVYARIGLHTGAATVGNMGSTKRFNYTMLGDAANLASRLEGINKYFHTYFMASAAVVDRLAGAYPARELSRVAVVGRREPVTVFEPMLPEQHESRRETLAVFHRGLQAFYGGSFAEAGRIFATIADVDPPAAAYRDKCRDLEAHPPADGWSGVWVMTEK